MALVMSPEQYPDMENRGEPADKSGFINHLGGAEWRRSKEVHSTTF